MEAYERRRDSREGQRSKRRKLVWPLLAMLLISSAAPRNLLRAQWTPAEMASGSAEMIGQVAPPWARLAWVNSAQPLDLAQLRGKVILLRFFSDNPIGATAVRDLHQTYQAQGLAAVGIYAPEPMPTETDPEHVRNLAAALGFDFPVGVDSGWQTVNRYWLNRADAAGVAATFLIDRRGIIRYVQPDGRYEKNSRNRDARREYEKLEAQIKALLKEAPQQPGGGG